MKPEPYEYVLPERWWSMSDEEIRQWRLANGYPSPTMQSCGERVGRALALEQEKRMLGTIANGDSTPSV